MTKKDSHVYIRIEKDWKERLIHLAKTYPGGEVTSMWFDRKLLKEAILREEKGRKRKRKKQTKAK